RRRTRTTHASGRCSAPRGAGAPDAIAASGCEGPLVLSLVVVRRAADEEPAGDPGSYDKLVCHDVCLWCGRDERRRRRPDLITLRRASGPEAPAIMLHAYPGLQRCASGCAHERATTRSVITPRWFAGLVSLAH